MKRVKIERTGERPLEFNGEQIAFASTESNEGPRQNRFWQLTLYKTEAGTFCISVTFHTSWQGEQNTSFAVCEPRIEGIEDHLRLYDPLEQFTGYPPGSQYDEKRLHLNRTLKTAWKNAVSELLADFPEEV